MMTSRDPEIIMLIKPPSILRWICCWKLPSIHVHFEYKYHA